MAMLRGAVLSGVLLHVAAALAPGDSCMEQVRWYPGVQIHDAHPWQDLANRPNLTTDECGRWCCSRDDCVCFYHTSWQLNEAGACKVGWPCCWLKPTFNASRTHDDADCKGVAKCMSGVRGDWPPPPRAAA